ncbi:MULTISPECIES: hypothetical protein [unclassified Microcoleus]|uniref:hypothetical protein n=1 Tax=unclassified Microcoleus TaxID=2642155 RepID=UPI002FD215EC
MLKAWGFHEPKLPRLAVGAASTDPQAWLLPELAANHTTTATVLSIGTNVKIMSIY